MSAAFARPPRHAAGFPAGCVDTGDVLGRIADEGGRAITLAVVTSALRASVEAIGDHDAGLRGVRESLARVASTADNGLWAASYYGKDLVLTAAGATGPPRMRFGEDTRHGWAWERVELGGSVAQRRECLLAACYEVSMAARFRRDRPEIRETRTGPVLDEATRALSPAQAASLLAGVLVRPLGGEDGIRGASSGEDPRMPGVPSADGWADTVARRAPTGCYAVTDVHDIEWGTLSRQDGARLTEGNARQLLPLAEEWLAGRTDPAKVLGEAYRLRLGRETDLLDHLRVLSEAVRPAGRLHATLGDGLSGLVPDAVNLRAAVTAANLRTEGHMHSGAGVARLTPVGLAEARERAHFSLHVTKTLKGTGCPEAVVHEYGKPLGTRSAAYALDFLTGLAHAGAGQAGGHHLTHARRWRERWLEHLPTSARADFVRL